MVSEHSEKQVPVQAKNRVYRKILICIFQLSPSQWRPLVHLFPVKGSSWIIFVIISVARFLQRVYPCRLFSEILKDCKFSETTLHSKTNCGVMQKNSRQDFL